jgi:hypothetical protein
MLKQALFVSSRSNAQSEQADKYVNSELYVQTSLAIRGVVVQSTSKRR